MYRCTNIEKNAYVPVAARTQANQYNCKICGNRPPNIVPNPEYLVTENTSQNFYIKIISEEGCFIRA